MSSIRSTALVALLFALTSCVSAPRPYASVDALASRAAPPTGEGRAEPQDGGIEDVVESAEGEPRSTDPSLFLVVGAGANPEFEGADSYQPIPFTVVRYATESYAFEAEGLGGRLDLIPRGWESGWGAGPSYALRLARSDTGDAALDALDSVGTALELGGFVRFVATPGLLANDNLETRLTLTADVTGAHDGFVAEVEADYAWFPARNIRYSVGVRASSASDDFMDAYFGVDGAGSVASGLDAYDPDAGLRTVGAQGSAMFLFNENHGVFALLRYEQLVGDAGDSPIVQDVGSEDQLLFGVGYTYRF